MTGTEILVPRKTNLKGSKETIWLHEDSMNGIPPTFTERSAASTGRDASTTTTAYTCGSKCGQETKPVDSRQGTGDEHRAGTDYTCCCPGIVSYDIDMDGGSKRLFMPETVVEVFNE